jgi:hypothetical protein
MSEEDFYSGVLVRVPQSIYKHVIWRVIKAEGQLIHLEPAFAFFGTDNLANRVLDYTELTKVRMEDLGLEFMAFVDFIRKESQ